jgi:hypothetical protein
MGRDQRGRRRGTVRRRQRQHDPGYSEHLDRHRIGHLCCNVVFDFVGTRDDNDTGHELFQLGGRRLGRIMTR